jgi:hypothetical protein
MRSLTKEISIVASMAWCLSGVAIAAEGPVCRADQLSGLYVFSATGYTIDAAGLAHPKAIVELIQFNGDGTLSVPGATRSINGSIAQIGPGGTGSYTLGTDCRGSLAFAPAGPHFDIFASPFGDDLWMIQTDPNNVFQGGVTRVSR